MKSCRTFGLSASVVFNKLFEGKNLYSDSRSHSLSCIYQNGVVHTKLSSNYLIGLYLMTLDGSYQTGKTLVQGFRWLYLDSFPSKASIGSTAVDGRSQGGRIFRCLFKKCGGSFEKDVQKALGEWSLGYLWSTLF